ncbi:MAG: protoporphyrinogen oxidase [Proteobacteria bacterium]|nr:protoporphyrinogen oxidase [Pseudomonadota bacterium]MBU1715328.1 protoporphyrinogen oxidase [Pseudomonadota bacterium]
MEDNHDIIIVGCGLSGLSAAHFLKKKLPEAKVLILEGSERPGGAIQTFKKSGFQAEWGPHGFLNNNQASQELLADTGLIKEALSAPLKNFHRYVCFDGRLVKLPQGPVKLLSTPLLSVGGKLRLLGDLWKKPKTEDQTIGQWAEYRFGREVLPMVDVAVTGTFAGDLNRLSIDAVMPGVRQLEKEAGSVLRGLKKNKKEAASSGGLPSMLNFPQGMERLIEVLCRDRNIRFGEPVNKIAKNGDLWEVKTEKGQYAARILILALPVNNSLHLLSYLKPPPVAGIPGAKIINLAMGFNDSAKIPYGFGYLAPEREKRFALGAMFTSHMFPGRAPDGQVLVEALVGGRRHPERLALPDDELARLVYEDMSGLMELPEKPSFVRVLRSAESIPQLEMDHPALVKWRHDFEKEQSGIHICGFGWDGIGMNDMMKAAQKVALAAATGSGEDSEVVPVKPVYF